MDYGNIPQNRERIYIVGFLQKDQIHRFEFPDPIPLTNNLDNIIDRNTSIDDPDYKKYYYDESSRYYRMLKETIKSHETTYQLRRVYVRENKSNVCPTLTANMGTGGHNVPLILDFDNNIRKLTPKECFLLQGFGMANSHLYKQAGNSVTVPVIKRIAENILAVLQDKALPNTLQLEFIFNESY